MARKKTLALEKNPLISGPTLAERSIAGSPYRDLRLSDIDVDPNQPRRNFEESALQDLAASILEYGVLNPILVTPLDGGTYRLVAGERRYRASKIAGLDTVPAVIDRGEGVGLAKQLVENIQREDLSPLERAQAIGELREAEQWSIREIASRLGVSKGLVQRSLEILALPDDLQAALAAGASESKILLLGQVEDPELRKELLARVDDYTRAQLEKAIKQLTEGGAELYHGGTASKEESSEPNREDKRVTEELQKALGTRVVISRKANKPQQGKLLIEFYSEDDLDSMYRKLIS